MKTVKLSLPLILIGLQAIGCSSDESYFSTENVREVRATLGQFQDGEQEIDTRTSYSISEQSGFQTLWANGDVLGIYPIGGDQVSFPISNGVGTTSAKFDGGSWALRGTYKYAAYYPFSTDFYTTDQRALPVDFTGQVQNGNNSTAHLAAVDFMAAPGTQPSSNGSVNLQFNHVGCFMRMQLTVPEVGTYTCLTISSDNVKFPIKGTVDLSAATPAFKSTETTSSLTLGLTNFTTTSKNAVATFYMMVAPGNYSSSNLTFTLTDTNSKEYEKTVVGKNMLATMAYNYAMTLEGTGTGGNTGPGEWGASNMHNGHEYVDLGIKDAQGRTIYWATCNIGAETPEDIGLYFAWGETVGYSTETTGEPNYWGDYKAADGRKFDWASYSSKLCGGDPTKMKKYCTNSTYGIVDNINNLEPEDDAAHVNWGGKWRMPTHYEIVRLRQVFEFRVEVRNGTPGRVIYKDNSKLTNKSIFFPMGGRRNNEYISYLKTEGSYWTSTLDKEYSHYAYCLTFDKDAIGHEDDYDESISPRNFGYTIRPVCVLDE